MPIRIAFASTDGAYIDQHFGSARIFQVFDIVGSSYDLVDTRRTEPSCGGHCGGFDALLEILEDCSAVFVTRIGQGAADYVIRKGKRVFEASGPVEGVIERIIAEHLLGAEGIE